MTSGDIGKPGRRLRNQSYLRHLFYCILFLSLIFSLPFSTPAADYVHFTGCKHIENFSDEDHRLSPQNWCILQDNRGIIYVANQGGLLEYDGVSWRNYKIPNKSVRSMAVDDKGTLYVGGNNEFGFFTGNSQGTLNYHSLIDRLKDNEKNFSEVWRTSITKEGVYFSTYKFLFRWDPAAGRLAKWRPAYRFFVSFCCDGKFFIDQENVGLMKLENDSLTLIPGGEAFARKTVYMIAPYDKRQLLIGTKKNGFFIYDGRQAIPFTTEADTYLKERKFYRGIRLSSGHFALTTRGGGLVVIDSRGKLKDIFDKTSGLADDNVKYVFEDYQGNLWLALNSGISKIEYRSPVFIHDARMGLTGLVLSVTTHGDTIFAGTTRGLFHLTPGKSKIPGRFSTGKFEPVPGIAGACRALLSNNDLLIGGSDGVYRLAGKNRTKIIDNNSFFLLQSGKDRNRLWVGTHQGLFSLYRRKDRWEKEHKFKKTTHPIHTIAEDEAGSLWLGTLTKGVFKIDFPAAGTIFDPAVSRYDSSHGLPDEDIHVFWAAQHVIFATQKGIFRFDDKKDSFIPDETLGEEFAGGKGSRAVFRIVEDSSKHIWVHSLYRTICAVPRRDGTYTLLRKPFRLLYDQSNTIFPDPGGDDVWFANNESLVRFDKRQEKNDDLEFKTLIRKIEINGKPVPAAHSLPTFAYRNRKNFHFEFAAPFFQGKRHTKYRCFLEGHDDGWSRWALEWDKDFTTLDSGLYRFRVQAKNIYGNHGSEAVFSFRILPPWYRTWLAFLAYALILFSLMFLVVKWRSGKLEREKQKLERVVKERTKEIEEKNRQLEEQTLQLKEQSEKLKEMDQVKSRFFANISHEFRTPLTLIMGPLEQMLSDSRYKEDEKKFNLMLRNSQRLLGLINQLLELSKFESGKMKLQAVRQNIIPFFKGIVDSFVEVADRNELALTFEAADETISLYFDPGKLEEITFNLLSNALKFTPPGGKVTLAVEKMPEEKDKFPEGVLAVSVGDTGPGIPRDQLAHIFDRFYQSGSTYEHHQKGSGIGLAIAKELVELHHGSIDVHSSEGKGTEFSIRLPMGDAHLEPGEIVDLSTVPPPRKTQPVNERNNQKFYGGPGGGFLKEPPGRRRQENNESTKDPEITSAAAGKDIILVVEDSDDVREYIKGSLEPMYTVVEAKDGLAGIQKAQEIIPDLIISDIMMPVVDGCELCRALKNDVQTSHVPIILLTARASAESIISGLATGADDYITKPFNTKILLARIKNLIELRRHIQQTMNREMSLQPVRISVSEIDKTFIKKLHKVINENIADPDFNIEQLCKKMEMSQPSIYRKIHALSGESPTEFIRSFRLKKGAELLKKNFGSILEVALEVGFSSANYFTKCFKKKFHQLPSTYQAAETEG